MDVRPLLRQDGRLLNPRTHELGGFSKSRGILPGKCETKIQSSNFESSRKLEIYSAKRGKRMGTTHFKVVHPGGELVETGATEMSASRTGCMLMRRWRGMDVKIRVWRDDGTSLIRRPVSARGTNGNTLS